MIIDFERFQKFVEDNDTPTLRASEFLREMTAQVNLSTILSGAGSPEGVLDANPTQLYMDTGGTAGTILYIKRTGIGNTGWILT